MHRCRKSALQLDPRNFAEVDVEQQAGSRRLRAAALEASGTGRSPLVQAEAVLPAFSFGPFRIVVGKGELMAKVLPDLTVDSRAQS